MKHKGNNSSWQFIKLSHRGWFPWDSFWNVNLTTNSGSCVHAYNQDFTLLHHDCCTPMLIHPHWLLLATSTQHETKLWERSADCCGERWTVRIKRKSGCQSIPGEGGGANLDLSLPRSTLLWHIEVNAVWLALLIRTACNAPVPPCGSWGNLIGCFMMW